MSNIITQVKLDTAKNALDVEDNGAPIPVPRGNSATMLVWQLSGNAAQGSFNPLDAPNPGFKWVGTQPPANIFGPPSRSSNGNEITVSDGNTGASTGTWHYQLYATINGVQYSTTVLSTSATTNNPAIKNE
jgi:hypothetical protein